jgi:hypothetical protein
MRSAARVHGRLLGGTRAIRQALVLVAGGVTGLVVLQTLAERAERVAARGIFNSRLTSCEVSTGERDVIGALAFEVAVEAASTPGGKADCGYRDGQSKHICRNRFHVSPNICMHESA